ncbi:MAG: hypothetical protein PHI11_02520 [Gallionella sp.]|nr:hypothetical protein [Gallionella sp.]
MKETTKIQSRKLNAKVLCCALGLMGVVSGGDAQCYDARPDSVVLNIKPPQQVDIKTSINLMSAQEVLPPIMLAAATTTDATSVPATAATQKVKYDAVYSMCGPMHSADQVPYNIERDNGVSPMTPIYSLMFGRGMTVEQISATPVNIKVLKAPTHGELVPSDATSFTYHANSGYLGSDQMVFEVETMGKKFKVVQTVVVHNSGNLDYPTSAAIKEFNRVCPSDKRSSLDMIGKPDWVHHAQAVKTV